MQLMRIIPILLSLAAPLLVYAQPAPATLPGDLKALLSAQEQAWNRGDGVAWASAFSDDADFVNIRGDVFHGRDATAAQHTAILGGPFQGSHAEITVRQVTVLAPNVVLIETVHHVTGFQRLPPGITATSPGVLDTRMKYVAVRAGEHWQFVAAQNTVILGRPPQAQP